MDTFTDTQLQAFMQMVLWPAFRIGGLMLSAPVLGDRAAPARVRLVFSLLLTLMVAPALPQAEVLTAFTAAWWLRSLQEVLLGLLIGFSLKLVFEAVMLGGELIGSSMGLGFARMADPLHGTSVPVLGSFMQVMAVLLFLALGGHLRLIELLVMSFRSAPLPDAVLSFAGLRALADFGGIVFLGGVCIALPMMASLLLVNLAFGFMSRSAPALNGLSVGLPLSLAAGIVLLRLDLPSLQRVFVPLLSQGFEFASVLAGVAHGG